jgi:hypothetical protein
MENYFLFKEKKKKTRNKVSSHASLKNVAPNKKHCWSVVYPLIIASPKIVEKKNLVECIGLQQIVTSSLMTYVARR